MNESLIWWVVVACCAGAITGAVGVVVCGMIMDCTGCENEEDEDGED